jgi:hypothetical protein
MTLVPSTVTGVPVGVSATAVYRHFPDKAALLAALSAEGDEQMAAAFGKAMAKEKPGIAAFNAMGRAYVHFALKNPSLFRLMMTADSKSSMPDSRGRSMLVRAIEDMSGGRAGQQGIRMRGRRCWPLVWLDGTPMPSGDVDLDGIPPNTIHGIELYLGSTTAPARYNINRDNNSCGTILLWRPPGSVPP